MEGPLAVPVAGGSLAVYRSGAVGPVVLAVHGITSSSHTWVPLTRRLRDRCSIVAPDLRGRGRSNGLPGPYGTAAYVRDLLAVLDGLGIESAVATGHSLGAYIVARLAAEHPERVRAAVLVDGGLTIPGSADVDPQQFIDGFLGPGLARLKLRFPTREAYREWWRAHPALAGRSEVADDDLAAYSDHDLVGEPPEMHSAVVEDAVRADAEELFEIGKPAHRLTVPATLACAPLGLMNDPNPMQPVELVEAWAAEAPELRRCLPVPDVNHYTITLGAPGAAAVAEVIAGYL